jgi:hypothetical protein
MAPPDPPNLQSPISNPEISNSEISNSEMGVFN